MAWVYRGNWQTAKKKVTDAVWKIAQELLALSQKANTILEIEIGVVGGEEDGVVGEINEKLYTTTEDARPL